VARHVSRAVARPRGGGLVAATLTVALTAAGGGCSGSPDAARANPDAGAALPGEAEPTVPTAAAEQAPRPPLERLAAGTGAAIEWPAHVVGERTLMQLAVVVPCGDPDAEPAAAPSAPSVPIDTGAGAEPDGDGDAEPAAVDGEAAAGAPALAASAGPPTCALRLTIAAQLLTIAGDVRTWRSRCARSRASRSPTPRGLAGARCSSSPAATARCA